MVGRDCGAEDACGVNGRFEPRLANATRLMQSVDANKLV